ncbi:MAG TPA: GyrI-like domain-containing protein [Flavisolibacter sp.]
MEPTFQTVTKKILVGKRLDMSLSHDTTGLLWKGFMPRVKEIENRCGTELYSLQIYNENYFEHFNPQNVFEKWAAVEASHVGRIPHEMEAFTLSGGLYAVFLHKGAHTDTRTFQYIFSTWLPNSDYVLDNRPHFEILGAQYKHGDPLSEEEIWIPVRPGG